MKKYFYLAFLLTSCQSGTPVWVSEQGPIQSSRATYPPASPFSGIEVELRAIRGEVTTLLKFHSIPFQKQTILVALDEQEYQAQILRGGQCALLSQEGTSALLEALSKKDQVLIKVGRYQQLLTSGKFSHCKKTLGLR